MLSNVSSVPGQATGAEGTMSPITGHIDDGSGWMLMLSMTTAADSPAGMPM